MIHACTKMRNRADTVNSGSMVCWNQLKRSEHLHEFLITYKCREWYQPTFRGRGHRGDRGMYFHCRKVEGTGGRTNLKRTQNVYHLAEYKHTDNLLGNVCISAIFLSLPTTYCRLFRHFYCATLYHVLGSLDHQQVNDWIHIEERHSLCNIWTNLTVQVYQSMLSCYKYALWLSSFSL